jgi:hypothetical protein
MMAWATRGAHPVLSCHARLAAWLHPVASPGIVAVLYKWSKGLVLHCNCLSTHLAGIKCATWLHALQAHDGSDIRRLENIRACVGNMRG